MRTWIPVSLIALALAAYGCTHAPSRKQHAGVEKKHGESLAALPATRKDRAINGAAKQPSEEQLKARLTQLLKQLASDKYEDREKAQAELARLVKQMPESIVSLKRAHREAEDPQVKHVLQSILKPFVKWALSPAVLRAIPDILEKLESGRSFALANIVTTLGYEKPEGSGPLLVKLLENPDSQVRLSAAMALGNIGYKPATMALRKMWQDDRSREVQVGAASSVARMEKDENAFSFIVKSLQDNAVNVRKTAAEALGKIGDKRAFEPLIGALKDNSADVRDQAAWALAHIRNKKAIKSLIGALNDSDANVRGSAALALGYLGDDQALEPLTRALRDHDTDVRIWAAAALGELGDKRATEPLIKTLKDENEDVRGEAAGALGQLRDKRATKALIKALQDQEDLVRDIAAWALGEICDKRAIKPLIEILRDKDEEVRSTAAKALSEITKQDFGEDYEKWKKWYEKNKDE